MKQIKYRLLLSCLLAFVSMSAYSQRQIHGMVDGRNDKHKKVVLQGAIVETIPHGSSTQTDAKGMFMLSVADSIQKLVVLYTGFETDTVILEHGQNELYIQLNQPLLLKETVVRQKLKSTEIGLLSTMKTEKIGQAELFKAACCNLSESFETTPSVDVSFTDAVSGYKQIAMLGLSGSNTLITRENIPDIRGLASVTGLTFTPGAWVESMQLSKGSGSVVNGFEGLAGQINVELQRPFNGEKWFINLYQNSQGRSEANINFRHKFTDSLATNVLVNSASRWTKVDQNNDGFVDQPLGNAYNILNRWVYAAPHGWEMQGGIKAVYANGVGGQWNYHAGGEQSTGNPWGFEILTKRLEEWAKIAKIFTQRAGTSLGLQLSNANHDVDAQYGARKYIATQNSLYSNLIFQTYINNTNHIIKAGISNLMDVYNEQFVQQYYRNEIVSGAFAEYSYTYLTKFNLVAGLRGDYNNLYGAFATPRLHLRYAPFKKTAIRASVGRGQHTANIFSENMGFMASSRQFVILSPDASKPAYGLSPEVAWNTGLNLTQKFTLDYRDGVFSIDYYYTHFQNQVVGDLEYPQFLFFYNLTGQSFAYSFQTQLDYELIHNLNVRLAYRYYDVKVTYQDTLSQKPLVPAHRAFINIGYETKNKWKLDYTLQWISTMRTPGVTHYNHGGDNNSPSFFQMNAQITKSINDHFDIYVGGENLTNYMQHDAIIGASDPFGRSFDASMIWGPMMGFDLYMGLRFKIK